jgi:hypothetical protein
MAEEWMVEANRRFGAGEAPARGSACDLCRRAQPRAEVRFFQLPANLRSSGLVMHARSLFLCRSCWEGRR